MKQDYLFLSAHVNCEHGCTGISFSDQLLDGFYDMNPHVNAYLIPAESSFEAQLIGKGILFDADADSQFTAVKVYPRENVSIDGCEVQRFNHVEYPTAAALGVRSVVKRVP